MLLNSDLSTFKKTFENKLCEMLSPDELGAFILVLANSMQDDDLQKRLNKKLNTTFSELSSLYKNKALRGSPDDLMVFEALLKTGISDYSTWKSRQIDAEKQWQCAFNPLRGLRPERASNETFAGLQKPFNEDTFHFDKPFLKPEIISEETFQNTKLRVMYHKFPFAPYHLLIVIEAPQHKPQYLDKKTHQMVWELTKSLEENIPGFAIAYNSLGAGASVNHHHIHSFVDTNPMSVEQSIWTHNGGKQDYPLPCNRLETPEACWAFIEQLHSQNQPYNLLYRKGVSYVLPRLAQGINKLPSWLGSVGWYEACGGFNLTDRAVFNSLTTEDISIALSTLQT